MYRLGDFYKAASSAVEMMRGHQKHFSPEEDEYGYVNKVINLRALARRRMKALSETEVVEDGVSYNEEQKALISEVLLACYQIMRYHETFEANLDVEWIYTESGERIENPDLDDEG